jgi:hypothetical protein
MKTLFIAALVGLLVVPVVGNANTHNQVKSTRWDHIRSYQQLNKIIQFNLDKSRERLKAATESIDRLEAAAKMAPDKIQREQLLRMVSYFEKIRKESAGEIRLANQRIRDNKRAICGLYNRREVPKECLKLNDRNRRGEIEEIEFDGRRHGGMR